MRPFTTKAVILARGLGTRMRRDDHSAPLDDRQRAVAGTGMKSMMPIGRPFLDYSISGLADAGITDVCVVIGPEHQAVRDHYAAGKPRRIRLAFAMQQDPRGTADAVLAAERFVDTDTALVLNGDNYYPIVACQALRAIGASGLVGFLASSLVSDGNLPADRVARFPLVEADEHGLLAALTDRDDAPGEAEAGMVSMNLWSFTPAIFAACRAIGPSPRGELEIQAAVRYAMRELGEPFRVIPSSGAVLDLTRRVDVASVTERLRDVMVRL